MTNKTCRVATRSQQKLELHKLVVARSDFGSAQSTCRLVLEQVKGVSDKLYPPLFQAAVIAYGRPFIDNKSTGVLSSHWRQFTDTRLKAAHEKLIQTRNELIAHSDSVVRAVKIVPAGVALSADSDLPVGDFHGVIVYSYFYPRAMFVDTYDTCSNLIGRLNARIELLLAEFYKDCELPQAPFELKFDDGLLALTSQSRGN